MSEFAQSASRVLAPRAPVAKRLALPMAVSLVTCAVVVPALLSAPQGTRRVELPIFLVGAVASFGVGLYDFARAGDLRFARALVAGGVVWSLSALAGSTGSAAYSVGRVSQWLVELAIVYMLLSYPSGRLTGPVSRRVFAAAVLLVALLYLPTALLAKQYPNPSPWSMCTDGCPRNAFALGGSTARVVPDVMVPLRELLTVALVLAVAGVAIQRTRNAGLLMRRMCTPTALIAVLQVVVFAVYFRARAVVPTATSLNVLSWLYVLSLPSVALAAAAGWVYQRVFAAKALDRIARELRTGSAPPPVGSVLAEALEDPSLRILHSFPGDADSWVDETGAPVTMSGSRAEHAVTEVVNGTWRVAIVHDPALAEDPALMETAASYALAALENERLSDRLRTSLKQLAEARAFGVNAERRERRKIERDIHDGAQQRLVSLRIKLGLAADQIGSHDAAGGDVLRALGDEVDATIDEVRSFAQGIYPALLVETGLGGALRMLAGTTALPTSIEARALGRYSRSVETTIYFSVSEALQNVVKHARGATRVTVRVWEGDGLNFAVHDDGPGFDSQNQRYGTGLRNLGDRLAAVGGTLMVESAPGEGTTIAGTVPT